MRHFVALFSLPLLLVLPGISTADDAAPKNDRTALFDKLDANADDKLTAEEAGEKGARLFERLLRTSDANGDGVLTREEFASGTREKAGRRVQTDRPGQRRRPDPQAFFKRLDRNGDGKVTLDEIPEQRKEIFERMLARLDKNGDKSVTLDEFKAARGARPTDRPGQGQPRVQIGALMRTLDTNGDGKLSKEEIAAAPSVLKKVDANEDGEVTADELLKAAPRPEMRRPGGPDAGRFVEAVLGRIMQSDKDGDGKISRDEAPERLARGFDRIDGNGDGFVDKAELKTALEKIAQRRGPRERPQPRKKPERD